MSAETEKERIIEIIGLNSPLEELINFLVPDNKFPVGFSPMVFHDVNTQEDIPILYAGDAAKYSAGIREYLKKKALTKRNICIVGNGAGDIEKLAASLDLVVIYHSARTYEESIIVHEHHKKKLKSKKKNVVPIKEKDLPYVYDTETATHYISKDIVELLKEQGERFASKYEKIRGLGKSEQLDELAMRQKGDLQFLIPKVVRKMPYGISIDDIYLLLCAEGILPEVMGENLRPAIKKTLGYDDIVQKKDKYFPS